MKEIAHLLKELKEQGIALNVAGDNLEVSLFNDDIEEAVFDQIRSRKPEIIDYINSLEVGYSYVPIPQANSTDSYPISAAQRRIWLANKLNADPTVYNLSGRLSLSKSANLEHFQKAIFATIERHEILRTVFREVEPGVVRQIVKDSSNLKSEISLETFEGTQEHLEQFLLDEAKKPFDLENGPLMRMGILKVENGDYLFYYNMHHIVSDGWSKEIMTRDVFQFYHANEQGEEAKLPDLEIQYKDYTLWQINQENDAEFREHITFWMNALSGSLPNVDFAEAKARPKVKSSKGRMLSTSIDVSSSQKLKQYAVANGGTLFMGLLAALKVLIYRYTGKEDIIVATPTAGREHPQLKDQIGFYANTLALRNQLNPFDTFDTLFQRIKETTFDSFKHQSYPFDKLVEDLSIEKNTSRNPIFDIMLTLQNIVDGIATIDDSNAKSDEILDYGYTPSKFDIEIEIQEVGNELSFNLVFNTDLFEDDFIRRFMSHFKSLVNGIMDHPNEKINSVEFLTEDDIHQLRGEFKVNSLDRASGENVLDLFYLQVKLRPDEPALTFCHANEKKTLTYRELNEVSNQLCHYLHETHSLNPEDLISLKLERSEWLVVSILAILKAGCAYVPIDTSYPRQRIDYMEHNANCVVSLDEAELEKFRSSNNEWSKDNKDIDLSDNNLSYVIYTSGSTGDPKGVMVEHGNLYQSTRARMDVYPVNQRFLLLSSVAFDSSIAGIFGTLCSGGQLIIAPTFNAQNLDEVLSIIVNEKVTQILTVPSVYLELIPNFSGKKIYLQIVTVAGEKCPERLVNVHHQTDELKTCALYNEYGPTECSVWATYKKYSATEPFTASIGKPINNTEILILNEMGKLQPLGVVGEINIGGSGVARGYLNDHELTKEKFIQSSYVSSGKIYKTGDLGRWTKEGELIFLGRVDDQVKIRGHRVQLEEIEHALSRLPSVEQVAVVAVKSEVNEVQLRAYIVVEEELDARNINDQLQNSLPNYMIPTSYTLIEEMPLTANGKTDKEKLIQLTGKHLPVASSYVAPRTELEKRLVEIWEEILHCDNIGVKDNFFSLGGHSLSVLRLMSKIQDEFDSKFDVVKLFEENTIEKIAQFISIVSDHQTDRDTEMEEFKI